MNREVNEENVAFTERTPTGLPSLPTESVVVDGPATLDRVLGRQRNFTVEGRGDELPSPEVYTPGAPTSFAATVQEVQDIALATRRAAADATGLANCAAEVLGHRAPVSAIDQWREDNRRENQEALDHPYHVEGAPAGHTVADALTEALAVPREYRPTVHERAPRPITPEDRVMGENELLLPDPWHETVGTIRGNPAAIERMTFDEATNQDITRILQQNILDELDRENGNEPQIREMTPQEAREVRPNYVTPGVTLEHGVTTHYTPIENAMNDATIRQNANGDIFGNTNGNANWIRTALGDYGAPWNIAGANTEVRMEPSRYFCPSCEKTVTSKFTFISKEEDGEEEKFEFCSRCLGHALHQLVPKLRPIEPDVLRATVTYTPPPTLQHIDMNFVTQPADPIGRANRGGDQF